MKKFAWWKCWKIFLEANFSHSRKLFFKAFAQNFRHHSRNIIVLENFLLSFSQS